MVAVYVWIPDGLDTTDLLTLSMQNQNISTIQLDAFTGLTSLKLNQNVTLDELVLQNMDNLVELEVAGCTALPSLDLSGAPNIESVIATTTKFTSFDGTGLGVLETINLAGNRGITDITLDDCYNLTAVTLTGCIALESYRARATGYLPDFTGLDALVEIDLTAGFHTAIDISAYNQVSTFLISGSEFLETLNVSGSAITALDLSGCDVLQTVNVSDCPELLSLVADGTVSTAITSVLVSGCTALGTLAVGGTQITSLDLAGCAALTSLDISACTSLITIDLTAGTALQDITAPGCTALTSFTIQNAVDLSIVDLEGCTALTAVDCSGCTVLATITLPDSVSVLTLNATGFTMFDISGKTSLTELYLFDCAALTSVDASDCTALEIADVSGCALLASLDVSGGTALLSLVLDTNPSLATLNISDCGLLHLQPSDMTGSTAVVDMTATGCSFSVAEMDAWLTWLDDNGLTGGSVNLRTNTLAESTTLALKTTLEGNGWTVLVDVESLILSPSVITAQRGTAFSLTVQAINPATGQPNLSYVPASPLSLSITPLDPSDVINTSSIAITGWSNGQKTITGVIVSGGSTDTTFTLSVADVDGNSGTKTMGVTNGAAVSPTKYKVRFPYSVGYTFVESSPFCDVPEDYIVNEWSYETGIGPFEIDISATLVIDQDFVIATCSGGQTWKASAYLIYSGGRWLTSIGIEQEQACGTTLPDQIAYWIGRTGTGQDPNLCPMTIPYLSRQQGSLADCVNGTTINADGYAVVEPVL